jgi:hypothetical protein
MDAPAANGKKRSAFRERLVTEGSPREITTSGIGGGRFGRCA